MALGKLLHPVSVNMLLFSHLKLLQRTEVHLQPLLLTPTGVKKNLYASRATNVSSKHPQILKRGTTKQKRDHQHCSQMFIKSCCCHQHVSHIGIPILFYGLLRKAGQHQYSLYLKNFRSSQSCLQYKANTLA